MTYKEAILYAVNVSNRGYIYYTGREAYGGRNQETFIGRVYPYV